MWLLTDSPLSVLLLFFDFWEEDVHLIDPFDQSMASSSRGRSNSPFGYRKPSSSPYSSTSSSSSLINGRSIPRSCSSSTSSFHNSGNAHTTRSTALSRSRSDSIYGGSRNPGSRTPVSFPSAEELIGEPVDVSKSGDSISVTIRFRPLR